MDLDPYVKEVSHPEDALSLGLEELDGALEGALLVGDHRERIRHGDKVDSPALGELGSNLWMTERSFPRPTASPPVLHIMPTWFGA